MTFLEDENHIASLSIGPPPLPAVNALAGGKCFVEVRFKAAKIKLVVQVPTIYLLFRSEMKAISYVKHD
jgi:hypothetical protein